MAGPDRRLDARIATLLTVGTYAAVGLLVVGVVLMAVTGRSPLDTAPDLDPGTLLSDVVALRPAGFLWLGLIALIATPSARVVAALVGYAQGGEREMAVVASLILAVIALGVVVGLAGS
jgi:uncharacterized membrane protein